MKRKIKNNILDYFVLISPLIDVLIYFSITKIGVSSLLGLVIRGIFLIFVSVISYINADKANRKILFYYYFILFLYFFLFSLSMLYAYNLSRVLQEIKSLVKFFCFPIVLVNAIIYNRNSENNNSLFFKLLPFIYIILLLLPILIGNASLTYTYKEGYSGWFYSPNELSSILAIISPFIVFLNFYKHKILYFLLSIVYIYTLFTVGTKAPILGFVISLFFAIMVAIIRIFIDKKSKNNSIISIISLVVISISIIPLFKTSAIYHNMNVQSDNYSKYADSVSEIEINDFESSIVVFPPVIEPIIEGEEPPKLFPEIIVIKNHVINEIKPNKLLNMIFSNRDVMLRKQLNVFFDSLFFEKTIGAGIKNCNAIGDNLVELDLFDILFRFGIIGFIIYFAPIVIMIIKLFKMIFIKFKTIIIDNNYLSFLIAFIIGLLVSLLSGHVLGAPAVSILLAIIGSKTLMTDKNNYQIMAINKKWIIFISILAIGLSCSCLYNISKTIKKSVVLYINDNISTNGNIKLIDSISDDTSSDCVKKSYYTYDNNYVSFQIINIEKNNNKYIAIKNTTSNEIILNIIVNAKLKELPKYDFDPLREKLINNYYINSNYYYEDGKQLFLDSKSYSTDGNEYFEKEIVIRKNGIYEMYIEDK